MQFPCLLLLCCLVCLLFEGFNALVNIPCKHEVCTINVKPRTNVSATLVPPFRIVASSPIFSPANCNYWKEVCTQFDAEVVALTGTFGRNNVRNITFDCYPKGLSTLEVLRKGESVPKASKHHSALSPHYIRVNDMGQLEGSPQIVVSCFYSGVLIPYLSTGGTRVDSIMQTPTNGVCPPNIVCHKKIQRLSFYGHVGDSKVTYLLRGAFPEERLTVSLIPKG
ncbi:hypothetical protein TcWFU_005261 [Taenia crassiceps]|uniref:Uncharacterized protein n=1 Tax=Taenia crassiceps TaxID=6207 RepID=A0ABR4Q9I9_9CEST